MTIAPQITTTDPCPDCGGERKEDGSCDHANTCPLIAAKAMIRCLDLFWFEHVGKPAGVLSRTREIRPCERSIFKWAGINVPDNALLSVILCDEGANIAEFFTFPIGYMPKELGNASNE